MYWLGRERLDTLNKHSLKYSNQVERAVIRNATCNKLLPTGTVCVDHEIEDCGPLPGLTGMSSRDASFPPFWLSEKPSSTWTMDFAKSIWPEDFRLENDTLGQLALCQNHEKTISPNLIARESEVTPLALHLESWMSAESDLTAVWRLKIAMRI